MKQLEVPADEGLDRNTAIQVIADSLDKLDKNHIEMVPWPAFNYKPMVMFAIAHNHDCLFMKFYVSENNVRAMYRNTNDPVYKDSCVEFFMAFNGEGEYYNFEFNCLGTCRAAYGSQRNNRKFLPEAVISKIKILSVVNPASNDQTDITWQLTLVLPIEIFCEHKLISFDKLKAKANFFKCGDDLPSPHYLSWSDIIADEPNFHLPEFFGEVRFGLTV